MERVKRVEAALDVLHLPESAMAHLRGTGEICSRLAKQRGESEELAYIAGLLHDVSLYLTGSAVNHARRSAAWAEKMLRELDCFTEAEIRSIHGAVYLHSDKTVIHGALAELLKEADSKQKN